jgi:F-type H+-transporting ATPase subunit b
MQGLVELNVSIFFNLLNFIVIFLLLRHFLFKPVTEHLDARRNKIQSTLDEAEEIREEAGSLKEQYEAKMQNIRDERNEIIQKATRSGEVRKSEIIKEAREEAEKIKVRAEKEMTRERQRMINELKDQTSSIAMLAASKVLEKELDEKSHQNHIQEFINEVGDVKWKN